MALVILAGIILKISKTEWLICLIFFALVLSLELVNTAVEACVDLVTDEKKPLAKLAKDTAAGAVLVSAIFAAMTGLLLFPDSPHSCDSLAKPASTRLTHGENART